MVEVVDGTLRIKNENQSADKDRLRNDLHPSGLKDSDFFVCRFNLVGGRNVGKKMGSYMQEEGHYLDVLGGNPGDGCIDDSVLGFHIEGRNTNESQLVQRMGFEKRRSMGFNSREDR
jgi:hypothetical protein